MSSILYGIKEIDINQMITEQRTYKLWEGVGYKLCEAQLTADQINQLFANIEQNATAAGTNRTMIGKGKDAATAVNKAWEDLKTKIQDSKPITNFDQKISDVLSKIGMGSADPKFNGQVSDWVQKYRDFAKKHPVAQGAIYATLIALAGLSGAGVAGAAGLGLLKLADGLIQGKRASSAIYSGAKTMAAALVAQKVADYFKGDSKVDWDDPNKLKAQYNQMNKWEKLEFSGQNDTAGITSTATTGAGDTYSNAIVQVIGPDEKGQYLVKQMVEVSKQGVEAVAPQVKEYVVNSDPGPAKELAAALLKKSAETAIKETTHLSEQQVHRLFSAITLVNEGLWDTIKGKAQQVGKNLTTKITADKLMSAWKKAGSPIDSKQVSAFLVQQGVDQNIINAVYKQMKIGNTGGRAKGAPLSQTPNAIRKRQARATAKQQVAAPTQPAAQPAAKPVAKPVAQQKVPAQPAAQPAAKATQPSKTAQSAKKPYVAPFSTKGTQGQKIQGQLQQQKLRRAAAEDIAHESDEGKEVQVPGYGTMPLEMLKRHVQALSKEFNDSIQQGEFLKAAYRTEQFYNALMALAKALKQQGVSETISTGTTAGSAGIGGGAGLGIDKSPMEKVLEKPLGEDLEETLNRPKVLFNPKPMRKGPGDSPDDYEYTDYIPRGKEDKEAWAIKRTVDRQKLKPKKEKELNTGFYKNYLGNRPIREAGTREGALNTVKQLYLAIKKGDIPSELDLLKRQMKALMRKYNITFNDIGIKIPEPKPAVNNEPFKSSPTAKSWIDTLPSFDSPTTGSNYKKWSPSEIEEGDADSVEEHINSPGGMGQTYRKFTPKAAGLEEEQAPMFTPEENLSELKKDTIDDYISRKSALARGGLPEPAKKFGNVKVPAWKVAAAKIAKPGGEMEKYAKVKATLENEAKMVNANDPRSDGWRVYKSKPAGTKESAIMKGLQTESTLSEVNPVNVWATMSGKGQGGIPADLRVSEIPIDQIGSKGLFWGSYRDTVFYNIMSGNAFREYEQEYKKKGKEPDVEKIKQQVIKLAKAAGLEQDADGKWYFDVYTPMTKERKSHMTYLEYNFGRPYDKKDTKSKKESTIVKGLQTEAGSVTRWSKENPPPPELLLNTLIQILMNPENKKSPQDLISLWNDKYGLKHTLGGLRQYAQNDYKKAELSKALTKAVLANESSKGK